MRILINAVSAVAGGGMTYLVNLLKYLPAMMSEDSFLVVIQGIELPQELYKQPNLEIRKIADSIGSNNILKRYWWENTGLIKLCKRWKADVLYCIANMAPIVPVGIPTVTLLQNVAPITPRVFSALFRTEGFKPCLRMAANALLTLYAAARSNKMLVLSKSSDELLRKWIPFCKTEILPHGISTHFTPNVPRPVKAGNEPYFIFVSNIYVYKGLEYIVEAYKCNRKLPHIFIVGQAFDKNYEKRIKENIKEYGLENKIIFLSSLPYSELSGWYANAIANVFPTWCESFGCGIIEAQACGCPVVGFKTVTLPELCSVQELLAEKITGESLAKAMEKSIKISKSNDIRNEITEQARQYTWERAMGILKGVLKEQ